MKVEVYKHSFLVIASSGPSSGEELSIDQFVYLRSGHNYEDDFLAELSDHLCAINTIYGDVDKVAVDFKLMLDKHGRKVTLDSSDKLKSGIVSTKTNRKGVSVNILSDYTGPLFLEGEGLKSTGSMANDIHILYKDYKLRKLNSLKLNDYQKIVKLESAKINKRIKRADEVQNKISPLITKLNRNIKRRANTLNTSNSLNSSARAKKEIEIENLRKELLKNKLILESKEKVKEDLKEDLSAFNARREKVEAVKADRFNALKSASKSLSSASGSISSTLDRLKAEEAFTFLASKKISKRVTLPKNFGAEVARELLNDGVSKSDLYAVFVKKSPEFTGLNISESKEKFNEIVKNSELIETDNEEIIKPKKNKMRP